MMSKDYFNKVTQSINLEEQKKVSENKRIGFEILEAGQFLVLTKF